MKGRKIAIGVLGILCASCLAAAVGCKPEEESDGKKPSGSDDFQQTGNLVTADYQVDGVLDEEVWKNPDLCVKYGLDSHVEAKLVWGEKGLTVGFTLKDTTLAASRNYSDPEYVINSDNVEFYIDTKNDGGQKCQPDDYEFIFNPDGRAMLQVGGGTAWGSWSGVIDYEAKADGTINDDSDTDVGWVLEMFLPYTTFGFTKDSTIGISFGSRLKTTNLLYSDWYGWVNDPQIPDSYVSIDKNGIVNENPVEGLSVKSGGWKEENGGYSSTQSNSLAALTGKTLEEGTFKAEISGFAGTDSGIVFGMDTSASLFWESGGAHYYFLFINRDGLLILAQVDDRWVDLKTAVAIENFDDQKTYEIGVSVLDGVAYCMLDGKIVLQKEVDLTYKNVGIRAQTEGVRYGNLTVTAEVPEIHSGLEGLRFAQGSFEAGESAGEYRSVGGNSIGVLTEKTFAQGTFCGTVTAGAAAGDNGLIFALPANAPKLFWESETSYYFVFIAASRGAIQLAKVGAPDWATLSEQAIPSFNAANGYDVRIVWNGSRIAVYVNGALMIDYTDTSPLSGTQVGIRTQAAGITFGGFTVSDDVTMPEKPQSENYTFASGAFTENAGVLTSDRGSSLAVHRTLTMTDGTVSAEITNRAEGTGTAKGDNGIVFGLSDSAPETFWENQTYYFAFINFGGTLILAKVGGDPAWQTLTEAPISGYDSGNVYNLKVIRNGGRIAVFIDDDKLLDYTDQSPLTGSKLGVRASVANISFGNIDTTQDKEIPEDPVAAGWTAKNGSVEEIANGIKTAGQALAVADSLSLPGGNGVFTIKMKPGANGENGIIFGLNDDCPASFWEAAGANYYFLDLNVNGDLLLGKLNPNWTDPVPANGGRVIGYDPAQTYTFTVVKENARIRVLVDGTLYIDYTDPNPLNGSLVGVRTNIAGVEYTDASASSTLPDLPDFRLTTGKITVDGDKIISNGDTFCIYEGNTMANGRVSTKIKLSELGDCGIVLGVGYNNQNNFWTEGSQYFLTISGNGYVGMGKEGGGLGWSWPVNPHENRDTAQTAACIVGQEYTLSAEWDGSTIKAYLDDVLIFTYTDPDPINGIYVGIRCNRANTEYSEFTVTEAN